MDFIKQVYKKFKSCRIIIFKLPAKKDFLLYGDIHVSLYRKYLDFTLLNTHKKKIYLFLVLKLLVKFKKINFENYSIEFISYSKPKCVLTFMDNNLNFYKLKNIFPQIKFVAIQNAPRTKKILQQI